MISSAHWLPRILICDIMDHCNILRDHHHIIAKNTITDDMTSLLANVVPGIGLLISKFFSCSCQKDEISTS